jgi:YCII-related domain
MPGFVLRLKAPRPRFAQPLIPAEQEIMARHGAHWRPYLECVEMVAFGPVLTDEDSYGLAIVETDDERALWDFAAEDPVVTAGTASFEIGRMADDGTSARGGRDRRPARRGRTRVDARVQDILRGRGLAVAGDRFSHAGDSAPRTEHKPSRRTAT